MCQMLKTEEQNTAAAKSQCQMMHAPVLMFSDYNFAENQNNLRSPDTQDTRFLDVWSKWNIIVRFLLVDCISNYN